MVFIISFYVPRKTKISTQLDIFLTKIIDILEDGVVLQLVDQGRQWLDESSVV